MGGSRLGGGGEMSCGSLMARQFQRRHGGFRRLMSRRFQRRDVMSRRLQEADVTAVSAP